MKDLIFNIYKTLFFFDLSLVVMSLIPDIKTQNPAFLRLWQEAIPLVIIIIFTLIFTRIVERRRISVPVRRHKIKHSLKGLLIGLLMIAPTVVIMAVLKAFKFSGSNKVSYLALWIIAVLFSVITRELLLRGYLYQLYRNYYSITTVVIVNTLLFISLNLKIFNNGLMYTLNMLAMNVLFCLMLEFSKTVLIPIAAHFAYYTISSVLLGSLKLKGDYPYLYNCTFTGNKYISGGDLKIEGSVCLLAVELILIIFFIVKIRKRSLAKTSGKVNRYSPR